MRCSLRARTIWLLMGTQAVTGCLSEVLIDNYDNRGFAGNASDDTDVPPSAGGSTDDWSTGIGSNASGGTTASTPVYMTPAAPLVHNYETIFVQEKDPNQGYLPLLAKSSSETVLVVLPPPGTDGFALAEYSTNSYSAQRSHVFATEPFPTAMAVDDAGAVFLAGPLTEDISFGGPGITAVLHGYYLVKLNANWEYEYGFGVATTSKSEVAALVPDAAGNLYVGVNAEDTVGRTQSLIVAFDSLWHERFRIPSDCTGSATLYTLSLSPHGELLAGGSFTGTMTLAGTTLSTQKSDSTFGNAGFTARFETASGRATHAARTNMDKADLVSGYVQDNEGNYRQASCLGALSLSVMPQVPSLRGLDSSMLSLWQAPLGEGATLDTLVLGENGATYVAGRMWPSGATIKAFDSRSYVAEVDRTGSVTSYFLTANLTSSGTTWLASRPWLAVTANRVIWVSYLDATILGNSSQYAVVLSRLTPLQ